MVSYAQYSHRLLTSKYFEQGIKISCNFVIGCLECRDLAARMQNGGMVAATKRVTYVRQAEMGQFLG